MKIQHSELEKYYVAKMNKFIKGLHGYENGMEVVHIGGGIDVMLNGAPVFSPVIGGMLSMAHSAASKEIDEEIKALANKFKNKFGAHT